MKKFFTIIIVLSISFFLLIEFIGDRLIKNILENNVSSSLGRKVTIEKLNIDYLSGAADAKGINLLNKEFQGYLVRINSAKVNLDALSIFSNNILINDVQLKDISVNYYFNFSNQQLTDNVRSLQKDLSNKTTSSQSNKYFNIENLDAKNISVSVLSPELNIDKNFSLKDLNFKNIGNTNKSKDYKDELKKVFNSTVKAIKDRVLSNDFLNKLENFDTGVIEDKVKEKLNKNKDKLKNKLKSLIN